MAMQLHFVQEKNLIVITVRQLYNARAVGTLYKQSEYDENFTNAFKEFDSRNGYKGLKFGMTKAAVTSIVKLEKPDIYKQYKIINKEYSNWFYIPFERCVLVFNKKNQLYFVGLVINEYSNNSYESFLKELITMFGTPTEYKGKENDIEWTYWSGNNILVRILKFDNNNMYVQFYCERLNDSSPTDKLYE